MVRILPCSILMLLLWVTAGCIEWKKSSFRLEALYVQLDNKEYRSFLARLFAVGQRGR